MNETPDVRWQRARQRRRSRGRKPVGRRSPGRQAERRYVAWDPDDQGQTGREYDPRRR